MDTYGEKLKYYLCNALSYVSNMIVLAYVIISLFYTIANKMFYFVIITHLLLITSSIWSRRTLFTNLRQTLLTGQWTLVNAKIMKRKHLLLKWQKLHSFSSACVHKCVSPHCVVTESKG